MFQPVGDDSKRQRLNAVDRILPTLSVGQNTGKLRDSAIQRPSSSRSTSTFKLMTIRPLNRPVPVL